MSVRMKLFLLFALAVLASFKIVLCYSKLYDYFKVYSVSCDSTASNMEILKFWEHHPKIDFWSRPGINKTNHILVDPRMQTEFEEFLSHENFNYEILIENVGKTIKSRMRNKLKFHFQSGNFADTVDRDFSHYWTLPEIEDYITFLAQSTDLNVRKEIIGKSHEGRNIYALTISMDETLGNKPIVFIDSLYHAREWVGPQTVLYLLNQLVENYSENLELLKNDWIVVPMANPDGFQYSHTTDRFWRKNRRRIDENCVGVDINRNFRYRWKAAEKQQTPCSSTYPGPFPESEPETKAIADFMMQFKHKIKLYVSMHSCASFLLFPYSFDYVYISNWKQHEELCQTYVDTLNRITKFNQYSFGHSASQFYLANGVSDDFAVGEAKAEMSIVVELPGAGSKGFDFPEDELEDLVKETFVGLYQFGIYVSQNFN